MGVKIREKEKGSGVWWIFVNHRGARTSKAAGSLEMAQAAKEFIEKQITFGLYQPPKREPSRPKEPPIPTVREYWHTFRENYLLPGGAVALSTASGYETNFKTHILPALGDLRLDEVTEQHMEEMIAELVGEKGLAKATIQKILRELGRMYNRAIKHKIITENPASGHAELYSQAPIRNEKIEPLTVEEVPLFLEVVREDRFTKKHFALFLGAIHTGMRAGELAALEWGDIDWNGGFGSVERSFDRVHRKVVPTKTKRHRRVDLSNELLEALSLLKKARLEEWFGRGHKKLQAAGLWDDALNIPKVIFCNELGTHMDRDNISRRHYHRCLSKAGLKRRRFHDLRHTFASLHLTQGAPISWVSEQMGHSSIELTVKRYGHLQPGKNRHFVNSLPGIKTKNPHPGRTLAQNEVLAASASVVSFPASGREINGLVGAGDRDRTGDVQLGNGSSDKP